MASLIQIWARGSLKETIPPIPQPCSCTLSDSYRSFLLFLSSSLALRRACTFSIMALSYSSLLISSSRCLYFSSLLLISASSAYFLFFYTYSLYRAYLYLFSCSSYFSFLLFSNSYCAFLSCSRSSSFFFASSCSLTNFIIFYSSAVPKYPSLSSCSPFPFSAASSYLSLFNAEISYLGAILCLSLGTCVMASLGWCSPEISIFLLCPKSSACAFDTKCTFPLGITTFCAAILASRGRGTTIFPGGSLLGGLIECLGLGRGWMFRGSEGDRFSCLATVAFLTFLMRNIRNIGLINQNNQQIWLLLPDLRLWFVVGNQAPLVLFSPPRKQVPTPGVLLRAIHTFESGSWLPFPGEGILTPSPIFPSICSASMCNSYVLIELVDSRESLQMSLPISC